MPERIADATWNGTLTGGEGTVALGSGVWSGDYGTPDAAAATDPEELFAAGHASCFAMTVAYALAEAGFDPERADAEAAVTLDVGEGGFTITAVDLAVEGRVPDATADQFADVVEEAETHCPVTKALGGPDVEVSAALAE